MSGSSHRDESPHADVVYASLVATPPLTSSSASPSTVAMSTQPSQQPSTSAADKYSTQAVNIAASDGILGVIDDFQDSGFETQKPFVAEDPAGPAESQFESQLDSVIDVRDMEHRRTDHDRLEITPDTKSPPAAVHAPESINHLPPDYGLSEADRLVARRKAIMERLHADVGPLYLLCNRPHPISRPHPVQDLLSLYSLQPLAATVARNDPVTGEKRKLRKTYKGKIQAFGIAGRNQEVKHPEGEPGGLVEMMHFPDDEWDAQRVMGKEVENGLSEAMLSKLDQAMKMEPGPLPGFDATILGLDAPRPTASPTELKKPPQQAASTARPTVRPLGNIPRPKDKAPPPPGEPPRPKRANKKRRYDEKSFEGYGEGYVDDDVEMTGVPSPSDRDDNRGGLAKKKRKKSSDGYGVPTSGPIERAGSYGVGMVGVGSRVGSFAKY